MGASTSKDHLTGNIKAQCSSGKCGVHFSKRSESTKTSKWKKHVAGMTSIGVSLLSQVTLSIVGCISIHLVCAVRVERSHSRSDLCCVSAVLCVVSERGEGLWVSSLKRGGGGGVRKVIGFKRAGAVKCAGDNKEKKTRWKEFWEVGSQNDAV